MLNRTNKKDNKGEIILNEVEAGIAERISKLVMSQLKVNLMDYDSNRDCMLTGEDIFTFMRNYFRYNDISES